MTWLKVLESRACSAEAKPAALRFPPNVVGRKTVIHGQGLFKSPIRDRCQSYALGCRVIHVHVQVLAIAYLVHADLADRILLVFRERFAWVKRGFGEETLIITFVLSFVLIYKNKQYKYEYEEEGNIIDQLHIMYVCVKTLFFLARQRVARFRNYSGKKKLKDDYYYSPRPVPKNKNNNGISLIFGPIQFVRLKYIFCAMSNKR
jgi:hypothetical protein